MTIASGTIGTSAWSISDNGALTIGAGTFNKVAYVANAWPWYEYRDSITSATFTGDVVLTDNPYIVNLANKTAYMFQDCKNMTSVTGLERIKPSSDGAYTTRNMFYGCLSLVSIGGIASLDTSRLSDPSYMFYGCTSLTSLDLSGWDTSSVTILDRMFKLCSSLTSVNLSGWDTTSVTSMNELFYGCTALEGVDLSDFETPALRAIYDMFRSCPASVTFGTGFDTSNLNPDAPTASLPSFVESDKACENMRTHAIVVSDEQFVAMPATEKSGTWVRGLELTYYATAYRTTDGRADAFGVDVTIGVIWETSATTTTRELTVYQKLASASSYPSTPVLTESLTGDSGVTTVTVQDVGDSAYDFKVVFYDGTNYFTAYPSVTANVKLVTIDKSGNVEASGTVTTPQVNTDGEYPFTYQDPDIDTSQANNGLTANRARYLRFLDKESRYYAWFEGYANTSGLTQIGMTARNFGTGANVDNGLRLKVANDGTRSVSVSDAAAWRTALGNTWVAVSAANWIGLSSGWSITSSELKYNAYQRRLIGRIEVTATASHGSGNQSLGTVKAAYRPPARQLIHSTTTGTYKIFVDSDGGATIVLPSAPSSGTKYWFAADYIVDE